MFFLCLFAASSLFKHAELHINNNLVTQPGLLYGYRSYIEALLYCNPEFKNGPLQNAGWFPDDPKCFDGVDPVSSSENTEPCNRTYHRCHYVTLSSGEELNKNLIRMKTNSLHLFISIHRWWKTFNFVLIIKQNTK